MSITAPVRSNRQHGLPHYRWVILGVGFVSQGLCFSVWYAFPILFVAMLAEFGWSRAEAAGAFSILVVTNGVLGPIVGGLVERIGLRLILPAGALILGLGVIGMTTTTDLWQFYIYYGFIGGVGLGLCGWIPTVTNLMGWFPKTLGTASGIISAGTSLSILALIPLLQRVIDTDGWRAAAWILGGLIIAIVAPANALLQRRPPHPADRLSSRGQASVDPSVLDREWVGRPWTLSMALRTRRYWLVFFSFVASTLAAQMVIAHQVAYLVDNGYDASIAAFSLGLVGMGSIVGKLTWGHVSDRVGRECSWGLTATFSIAALGLLILAGSVQSVPILVIFGLLLGIGYSVGATVNPNIVADLFRGPAFGAIFGALVIGSSIGSALGAWIGGLVFDLTGSYLAAFGLVALSLLLGTFLVWLAAPRKVRRIPYPIRWLAASRSIAEHHPP
ncbi:MAG: MFS transporter [Chloroflexota bacterium]